MYRLHYDTSMLKKYGGMFIEHTAVEADKEPHINPHALLVYIAHASRFGGRFVCGGYSIDLYDGDVLLIKPNTKFYLYSYDRREAKDHVGINAVSVYTCSFLKEYPSVPLNRLSSEFPELKSFFEGGKQFIYTHDTNSLFIRDLMIQCMDDFAYDQPAFEYTVKCLLTVIMINIFRLYSSSKNANISENTNMIIGQAENYIKKHIHSKVSLDELAREHGITPRHLCRLFKKHTGMTFTQFTNRMRIEKLKDELENTDRPLYLIYNDFDFSSQHLNNIFKEYTGCSMSEYKAKFNYKAGNPIYRNTK